MGSLFRVRPATWADYRRRRLDDVTRSEFSVAHTGLYLAALALLGVLW